MHTSRMGSIACAAIGVLLALAGSPVRAIDGRYQAHVDGTLSTIELKSSASRIEGVYTEGALQFRIEGQLSAGRLQARLIEPQSGLQIALLSADVADDALDARIDARNPRTGQTASNRARFIRSEGGQAGSASTTVSPVAGTGSLDPNLIGVWINEDNINSGGSNFASFSTVMTLRLGADGSVEQWTQSVGGGGDWSYGGGADLQYRGRWAAADGVLQVQLDGMTGFQPAARYRFSGAYLVTEQDSGRRIWQRSQQ